MRQKKRQTDRSRTRRTDEVPFIAGCSHFTRKNTRFRAPASSPKQSPCNIMQPFQCDLQAQIPKHPITTHTQAHPKQLEATVTMRQKKRQTDRSRTRRTHEVPFLVGCSHFTRKNTRFRAPASSPKHSPCNIHAAITMRFAASRGKPAPIYARGNIKWRQWSSHSNAICNQRFKNRIELRTQTQPLVAKDIGRTIRAWNDRSRNRRTAEVPFIAGCSPFTRKNTRFRAHSGFLPKTEPLQHHAPLPFMVASSLLHHFPSSPLPFVTISLRHHFPLSPPRHCHYPSSRSIPPLLILLLCIVMLCIVMWSTTLHQGQFHRFIVTTLHQGQFHRFLFLCYVLLCDLPPFIKVNSTASYSCVMYCYVIYHPSSRSIPPLLILLLCIVMLCIVRSRTTLHHSQFHQVKVIRNSEVLLPNFLW